MRFRNEENNKSNGALMRVPGAIVTVETFLVVISAHRVLALF